MHGQQPSPGPTIARVVRHTRALVGTGCLAKRAGVARAVVEDVAYTAGLWHGPPVLRVLAEAERALGEARRHD
jgi:hypothetical protein